jgi:hypothetical protein
MPFLEGGLNTTASFGIETLDITYGGSFNQGLSNG